jgi:hypothetical protein
MPLVGTQYAAIVSDEIVFPLEILAIQCFRRLFYVPKAAVTPLLVWREARLGAASAP